MSNYTYASIVPLIGGETIAMGNVFGKRPEYILSYSAFEANDSQLLNYYNHEVPYYLIDNAQSSYSPKSVDVVNSVCPCAGLSSLSVSASSNSKTNDWMLETARYVLSTIKPKVLWGENAPRLASKMGEPVVNKLRQVANKHGYAFSLYKTKSILHGLSQVRDRSFYFFWKDDTCPYIPYYHRDYEKIEDTIRNAYVSDSDPMNVLANDDTPTSNPYYQFVLSELHPNHNHVDMQKKIERSLNIMDYIENSGVTYDRVAKWMRENGYDKVANRCEIIHRKLNSGGNIMRKLVTFPKDYIGAFVGHLPTQLTHPDEDRFLTIRECLHIMRMPKDFILQGGRKNINMICQNVPVTTAEDIAHGILKYLNGELDKLNTKFAIQDNRSQRIDHCEVPVNTLEPFI
jgi:site-specific DNA-cytosine methylase